MGKNDTKKEYALLKKIQALENSLKQTRSALTQRNKELDCLYAISKIAENQQLTIEELINQVLDIVPKSMQYPDISCAAARVYDTFYKQPHFQKTKWEICAPINAGGKEIGSIMVSVIPPVLPAYQQLILPEEKKLIIDVSERIGKIIERIKQNDKLKEVETRYDLLTEKFSDGIAIIQDGKYQFVNAAFLKMTGFDAAPDLIGKPYTELISKNFSDAYEAHLEMVLESQKTASFEYILNSLHDETIWVEENNNIITWHSAPALLCTIRDINDKKKKELFSNQEKEQLQQENIRLRSTMKDRYRFQNIIGISPAMQQVYDQILTAANSDANVSIYGESGTGKELVSKAIHDLSNRESNTFVTINCGAIPEQLLESEFFGYKKGAFTGAVIDKHGYLDLADNGTLFLDEIGDLPVNMQVKLLRAIDGGGYHPIGSQSRHSSNFRIIAATNKDLKKLVLDGRMREDFYYRIQVIPINLPPLKNRREDIPLLVDHFAAEFSKNSRFKKVPDSILARIFNHDWPGNIRELQNALLRFFSTGEFEILCLPKNSGSQNGFENSVTGHSGKGLSSTVEEIEKKQIIDALQAVNWHRTHAAVQLGVSRSTLFRRMKKYGLNLKQNVRF